MKKQKKLVLKKLTVSNLNGAKMDHLLGGSDGRECQGTVTCPPPPPGPTDISCPTICITGCFDMTCIDCRSADGRFTCNGHRECDL